MSTLHCALENGADLYVNERQKIRHYHARSTEERRRMPNHDFYTLCGAYVKLRYIATSVRRYDTIMLGLLKKEEECQITIFILCAVRT